MTPKKVSIIGSGNTGTVTALLLALKGLCNIVLLDVPQKKARTKGKALDLIQSRTIFNKNGMIIGTDSYAETRESDIVIITAGVARKPGMSRNDLLETNIRILDAIVREVVKFSPGAVLLILSNPVDVMTYEAYKLSGFPRNRVIGQAGVLDTGRYRTFIADELNVGVSDVTGMVLGVHGDEMVPLSRYTFVKGIPLEEILPENTIQKIIQHTRCAGKEIVELLENESASFAPAASLVEMAESILLDEKRIFTGVAYLEGEYGYTEQVLGVPLVLGANGIERIIELKLLPKEKEELDQSAYSVNNQLKNLFPESLQAYR